MGLTEDRTQVEAVNSCSESFGWKNPNSQMQFCVYDICFSILSSFAYKH